MANVDAERFKAKLVGPVLVLCWQRDPNPAAVVLVEKELQRAAASHSRFHFMVIIPPSVGHPDRETASEMNKRMAMIFSTCATVHGVVLGDGAVQALVRTFLRGMNAIAVRRGNVFIHSGVEQAAAELAKQGVPEATRLVTETRDMIPG